MMKTALNVANHFKAIYSPLLEGFFYHNFWLKW